jgi:hypothetical protein
VLEEEIAHAWLRSRVESLKRVWQPSNCHFYQWGVQNVLVILVG